MQAQAITGTHALDRNVVRPPPMAGAVSNLLGRVLRGGSDFELHGPGAMHRAELEGYIAQCFAAAYQAEVHEFAPLLLELNCAGHTSGVAGIRPAAAANLFVEHYLDAPVEDVVASAFGAAVNRSEIVEIANLAALRPGACHLLLIMLAAILDNAGFRYAAFAGTSQVARILAKFSADVRSVGAADPQRLGSSADQWGSYYDTCPQVLILDIAASAAELREQRLAKAVFAVCEPTISALTQTLQAHIHCSEGWARSALAAA